MIEIHRESCSDRNMLIVKCGEKLKKKRQKFQFNRVDRTRSSDKQMEKRMNDFSFFR